MATLAQCLLILCFATAMFDVSVANDAEHIMTEFSGQPSIKKLQATHRDLKTETLLSSIRDGKTSAYDAKQRLVETGFDAIKRFDPKSAVGDVVDLKHGLMESSYDKTKGLISKLLNLLDVPVGEDPLQDVLDAGVLASAGATFIAADLTQTASSNLDRILWGHKQLKDAYTKSEAEIYKALVRNLLLIKEALGGLSGEVEKIEDEYCESAEFTPPERKRAEYRSAGLKLTFKTGLCALDYKTKFLDWNFKTFCIKPSIVYTKTPPMFISEHTTPAEFETRECKHKKLHFDEVEAVLHTFDGASFLDSSLVHNALFSNLFPHDAVLRRGSFDGFKPNGTLSDIFGSLVDWDLSKFDLRHQKPWELADLGYEKKFLGAAEDLEGLFTSKLPSLEGSVPW